MPRFARPSTVVGSLVAAILGLAGPGRAEEPPVKRQLLAIGMSTDWEHESTSDALATLYQLGRESGLWETTIRTDVEYITKKEMERNAKNLDHFDAVFFMIGGELPLDDEQKAALLSFVAEDGKGFLGAHSATAGLYEWPEYGELIGGYFDGHPWNQLDVAVDVTDTSFVATRHFPKTLQIFDEIYQIKGFAPESARVLMALDTSSVDMEADGVTQSSVPITWTRQHGRGRVFYSSLGHPQQVWDRPDVRKMWLEAVKWAMRLDE